MTDLLIARRYGEPVTLTELRAAVTRHTVKRSSELVHWSPVGGAEYGEPPPYSAEVAPTEFYLSEAVNAAVNAYANKIAASELKLYQRQGDGHLEELTDHPAMRIIENPNPFMTRFELMWHVVADRVLNGNHYWFLAGPANGRPSEIWPVMSRRTRMIRDKEKYIAGYITEVDNEPVLLNVAEVVPFRHPTPADTIYGVGLLEAARRAARTGLAMSQWNLNMFEKSNAVPAGIVSLENMSMTDDEFDKFKSDWRESYNSKSRRTAFVRGGAIQWQNIGLNQTDVDFLRGARWESEKIYTVFGTYHLLPANTAEDRKGNERSFLENHAWPMALYIAEVLSDQFFTFWGPSKGQGQLVARFEDFRPRERSIDLEEEREEAKGLFFNEWREKHGLEPKPGWDDILFVHVQSGVMPAEDRERLEPPKPEPVVQDDGEKPSPVTSPEDAQERAERRESAGDDVGDDIGENTNKAAGRGSAEKSEKILPSEIEPESDDPRDEPPVADIAEIGRELTQWQKFEVRRFGSDDDRQFEAKSIPAVMAEIIRRAVENCTEVESVKAIFQQQRRLAAGNPEPTAEPETSGKASIGTPSGTVVLYLSQIEDVLLIQQELQQFFEADAPVRYTPVEQLHITLAHGSLIDEPVFRDVFQETVNMFAAYQLRGSRLTTFDSGDAVPVVLLVDHHEAMAQLQSELYQSFRSRGVDLSGFSAPEFWQPHITLAYVDRQYFEGMMLDVDMVNPFEVRAPGYSFTRGDYINIHMATRETGEIHVVFSEKAIKAIQATRALFEGEFEDLLTASVNKQINRITFGQRMRTLIRKYCESAYRDGLADGGVFVSEGEKLDPDDLAVLNAHIAAQSEYVTNLGQVLFKTPEGISAAAARAKPAMWFNKSVMPMYQAGKYSADKNAPHLWIMNPLKQNCETCFTAAGQVHRYKYWVEKGIMPQSDLLLCGGWACGCQLQKVTGPSVGVLSTIPTREGGKAYHTHEIKTEIDMQPSMLPPRVQQEFTRVLGHQIVEVNSVTAKRPDGKTEVVMLLREEAGYYAGLSEDDIQQGLRMIEDRLTLIDVEHVNETDMRIGFVIDLD